MSLTISVRFLTGRAHLHPWQTHHSEGRAEWPPSHWRLLRAIVAVAGRGLTSLPPPDDVPSPKPELKTSVDVPALKTRGVPSPANAKLSFSKPKRTMTLNEQLTDAEAAAWKNANPDESLAAAIDRLRELAAAPEPVAMADIADDEIPLSRLVSLLHALVSVPRIWIPRSSGGHTRQYFPIHVDGMVKNTGSAVFDTFVALQKDQPFFFHWPAVNLDSRQHTDLRSILRRMTYFGRAESWCVADAHLEAPAMIVGAPTPPAGQTHWECLCIEDGNRPQGKEYRDYVLERRLAPAEPLEAEVSALLPRTKPSAGGGRSSVGQESFKAILQSEDAGRLLLRCLLRESGQDMKDGLERPVGTRWVHYAVPRAVFDVPRPSSRPRPRMRESVDLVRFTLNTATVNRPVLPPLVDTLLVADRFRRAAMAVCGQPGRALSGHEPEGHPCRDQQHAYWWPLDEDNDGFIDHLMVWAPGGFESHEADALRRLTRLRQRGGRPDLLVTPVFVGQEANYSAWHPADGTSQVSVYVSATPYVCPVHLSHGRKSAGRTRSLKREVVKSLLIQRVVESEDAISVIEEIVFDFAPAELASVGAAGALSHAESVPLRQFFPVTGLPVTYPPLPKPAVIADARYKNAFVKDPDDDYCLGTSVGLLVDGSNRFVRAMSFNQQRKGESRVQGRMLRITFSAPRPPRPFAIGSQCRFGLGLFVPVSRPRQVQRPLPDAEFSGFGVRA